MRKLLLKLANKIYKKYGFSQIKKGERFTFESNIFEVKKIVLEQRPDAFDTLKVELIEAGCLSNYLINKLNRN